MQILRNTPATLELKVYSSGDLTDLDATPTLVLTDANGDTISPGTVTTPETGVYRSVLDGQADLKTIKAVWSGVLSGDAVSFTQYYEIVGNHLFTEADARGARFTGQQSPLSDETVYPDAAIARMREEIAGHFEQETGRSWIRRYSRMELSGSGTFALTLRGVSRDVDGNTVGGPGRTRRIANIISATVNGTTVDPAILVLRGNRVFRTAGHWPVATQSNPLNVVVEYEYGDDPVDLEARENGLRTIVANLVPSDMADYTQTISQGNQSLSLQQNQGLRTVPVKTRDWLNRNPSMAVA